MKSMSLSHNRFNFQYIRIEYKMRIRSLEPEVQTHLKNQQTQVPINIAIGQSILSVQVFPHWSINKLKCLVVTQIPKLNFDEFELSIDKNLLRGNYLISQIQESLEETEAEIHIQIIKKQSQIKFKEYYRQQMGPLLRLNQPKQHPCFSQHYQRSLNLISSESQQIMSHMKNAEEIDENQEAGEENQMLRILSLMRLLGLYMFVSLLKSHGSILQILSIGVIVLIYAIIEWQKNRNNRNIQMDGNRNNNNQNRQNIRVNRQYQKENLGIGDKIKAQTLLRGFKIIEIIFVFFISFFPNWEIRQYLHQNLHNLNKAKLLVNKYRPRTYFLEGDPEEQEPEGQINHKQNALHLKRE